MTNKSYQDKLHSKQKFDHIVIMRVVAIILVVLGHATLNDGRPNSHMYSPENVSLIEESIKGYIYSFHMPLFFWISGYLFFYSLTTKDQSLNVINELKKKIQRLIIPLYATSFLILLPTILIFGKLDVSIPKQILYMLALRANDHLWFLKILFFIFLIIIPFSFFWKKSNIFVLIIFAVLTSILYVNYQFPIYEISLTFKFLPFFLLGMVTRKVEKDITVSNPLLVGLFLFILHFLGNYVLNHLSFTADGYLYFFIALFGIYYCYYLAVFMTNVKLPLSWWGKIDALDQNSYSIYLFHVSALYIILYINNYFGFANSTFRIIGVLVLGLIVPIYLQRSISKNRYLAFLFSIQYTYGKK